MVEFSNVPRSYLVLLFTMLFLVVTPGVMAHRIHLDVKFRCVELEVYYGDGTPVKNGDVVVYTSDGEVYLTGRTDDRGRFVFNVSDISAGTLAFEVEHQGHRVEVNMAESAGAIPPELPLFQRVIAGFGYILGIFGLSTIYLFLKMKRMKKCEIKQIDK